MFVLMCCFAKRAKLQFGRLLKYKATVCCALHSVQSKDVKMQGRGLLCNKRLLKCKATVCCAMKGC